MTRRYQSNPSEKANPIQAILAFTFCTLIGVSALFPTFILPYRDVLKARDWPAKPCVITSSDIRQHRGVTPAEYVVIALSYSYQFDGRRYTGTRYQFGNSGTKIAADDATIDRYTDGAKGVCYVNPANPSEAVMDRGFTREMAWGLAPLLFVVAGLYGIAKYSGFSAQPAAARWQPPTLRHAADFAAVSAEPRELRPDATRTGKLGTIGFFTLACYFPVVMGIAEFARGWHRHEPEWALIPFTGIFLLVAIGFTVATVKAFLRLFDPRFHLVISPGSVALAGKLGLEWRVQGDPRALTRLRIVLEGREETTRPNGKYNHTEDHVFYRAPLLDTAERADFANGRLSATVPGNAMHTLDTGHNRIIWMVRVEGTIPRWAGIKDEYPLAVLPMKTGDVS